MKKTIQIEWFTEDVLSVREDLTEEQAYEVLLLVKQRHDAEIGINWDFIRAIADLEFPKITGQE